MFTRRVILRGGIAALATAGLAPRLVLAAAPTDARFVMVLLRGGLDGLHAMPPWADPDYRRLRPTLALDAPGSPHGVLDLDADFGLHPALAPLHSLYVQGELLLVPAVATAYRARSHFDAQNMLENGSGRPFGARDGWLNRALTGLGGGDRRMGLALGPSVPLILQGEHGVQAWSDTRLPELDEDFLRRLALVYREDPVFARALADAMGSARPALDTTDRASGRDRGVVLAAQAAADLLARADGPRVAVMEIQGWDTHFAQAARLDRLFTQLAQAVTALRQGLGDAWQRTVVMIVSEFGRTVAENGNRGTDHGTAGLAMLIGGAVAGGRIAGQWPGLKDAALHEGRDLRPENACESLFKAVLIEHLRVPAGVVEQQVFPDGGRHRPMAGLMRV